MLPFSGALAAAITPSKSDTYQMDLAAALEGIDFLCSRHVRGIAIFGATGEFPHFSTEDRMRLAHMAIKRSRVPVLVNATHSCFAEVSTLIEHAADNGAAGILLQPPTYFRYESAEIRQFFLEIIEDFGDRLPILLYNLPLFNNAIPVDVASDLLHRGVAAGIKDSSGNWEYFSSLFEVRAQREFPLLVGNDMIYVKARQAGADGLISGCAGAIPELLVALDAAIQNKLDASVHTLSAFLDEFLSWVVQFPGPYAIRECLSTRGVSVGARAIPFSPETEHKAANLRHWFQEWLPAVLKECAAVASSVGK